MRNYKIEKLRDWKKNSKLISSDSLLSQVVKCFESDLKEKTNSECNNEISVARRSWQDGWNPDCESSLSQRSSDLVQEESLLGLEIVAMSLLLEEYQWFSAVHDR